MSIKNIHMTSKELMALPYEERNAAFSNMTMRQRAVLVAEDVIAQVIAEVYYIRPGAYLDNFNSAITDIDQPFQAQATEVESCNVCAIGATFLSCARLGNEASLKDVYREMGTGMIDVASRVFTPREMRAMETILENADYSHYSTRKPDWDEEEEEEDVSMFSNEELDAFKDYKHSIIPNYLKVNREHTNLLILLMMENVISNNGALAIPGVVLSDK
jgi:hypothetical protein